MTDLDELIDEARERAAIGADVDPIDAARLLNELADALEAATRERERDAAVAALDGAPEPEVAELPETGLEVRDGDGDLIMSGEHRKVLHQGGYVCDTCVNILGINVCWGRADRMEKHPLPVEGGSK